MDLVGGYTHGRHDTAPVVGFYTWSRHGVAGVLVIIRFVSQLAGRFATVAAMTAKFATTETMSALQDIVEALQAEANEDS